MESSTNIPAFAKQLHLSTTIDELLHFGAISVRTYNICNGMEYMTLGSLVGLQKEDVLKWRGCGKKVWGELNDLINIAKDTYLLEEANQTAETIAKFQAIQRSLYCFAAMTKAQHVLSQEPDKILNISLRDLGRLASCLPGENDGESFGISEKMSGILDSITNREDNTVFRLYGDMLSSFAGKLRELSASMKRLIEYSDIEKECREITSIINETLSIKNRFPFLNDDDIEFCIRYYSENYTLPKLYILYLNLIRSDDRQARILCYRYGLYPDGSTKSIQELAEIYNISKERVRQVADVDSDASKRVAPEGLISEADFSGIQFLSEDDPALMEMISSQNLNISPKQLIILIDIFSRCLGSTSFVKNGKRYLFSWRLWDRIRFDRIDSYIRENVSSNEVSDVKVPLDKVVWTNRFDDDYDDNDEELIKRIIAHYLRDVYKLDFIG